MVPAVAVVAVESEARAVGAMPAPHPTAVTLWSEETAAKTVSFARLVVTLAETEPPVLVANVPVAWIGVPLVTAPFSANRTALAEVAVVSDAPEVERVTVSARGDASLA